VGSRRHKARFTRQAAGEFVRHNQRVALIGFERYLLSQHDVPRDEIVVWDKTPSHEWTAGIVEFVYVRRGAVADPVFLSAVATNDFKLSFGIELRALLRR
jgi:hypothetical protein